MQYQQPAAGDAVTIVAGATKALYIARRIPLRVLVILALLAPVSVALGVPFPIGLSRTSVAGSGFLPWAWGLNGAMSVVATPLANLIAISLGFEKLLFGALLLYGLAAIAQPTARKGLAWQDIPSY